MRKLGYAELGPIFLHGETCERHPDSAEPLVPAEDAPAEEAADEPPLEIAPEEAPTLGAEDTAPEYPPLLEPIDG